MSVPNVEVVSAVTGESIAVFEREEFADASVKALKQRLAQQICVPRFRLRLLQDNSPLDDDQTLAMQVVQLVRMELLPPDMEQDREIIEACYQNNDKLLEQNLNQPRRPNFEDADAMTPLCAAALNGNLKCVSLLIETGVQLAATVYPGLDELWNWYTQELCVWLQLGFGEMKARFESLKSNIDIVSLRRTKSKIRAYSSYL